MTQLLNKLTRSGDEPGVRFTGGTQVMLGVALLGLVALCFIAASSAAHVWNAAFRVIWLVLTSLGLLLLALGMGFMKPMVRLLGATATCERYAIEYAT